MTTAIATADETRHSHERATFAAWLVASSLAASVAAAGMLGAVSLPVLLATALFLFFAVASDVRSYRVPNVLTLPALLAALLVSPWIGGTDGPLEALLGAGLGLLLLLGPYVAGGVGAGDVKALMALGAWLGSATTLGATAWALLAAGTLGLGMLVWRGELAGFVGRWRSSLVLTLATRRLAYEPPVPGSTAARGIPFAAALAVGVALQWWEGAPW